MINQNFLKQLVVLYVEDDANINEKMMHVLNSLFRKSISCENGKEALECFEEQTSSGGKIDVIISDINMPEMDGIEFLKEIRKLDNEIPFIFTTAYSDIQYTMTAIKHGVSHYAVKPINTKELLLHIQDVCEVKYQQRLVENARIELERYVDIVNQVAIISKTDPNGIITFVNDFFCEISKYPEDELIGQNQNIIRHHDMPSLAFQNLWEEIQKGNSWKGKIKNKAKDGEAYFVNSTIFPVYDDYNEKIVEYVGVQFLTTEEEVEKREFKKKVVQLYQESKRRDFNSRTKIDELQSKLKKYEHFDVIENNLDDEREKTDKLKSQIQHYEKVLKDQKEHYDEIMAKVHKRMRESFEKQELLEAKSKKISEKYEKMKEQFDDVNEKLRSVNAREIDQTKTIRNLRDVIKFNEGNSNKR